MSLVSHSNILFVKMRNESQCTKMVLDKIRIFIRDFFFLKEHCHWRLHRFVKSYFNISSDRLAILKLLWTKTSFTAIVPPPFPWTSRSLGITNRWSNTLCNTITCHHHISHFSKERDLCTRGVNDHQNGHNLGIKMKDYFQALFLFLLRGKSPISLDNRFGLSAINAVVV